MSAQTGSAPDRSEQAASGQAASGQTTPTSSWRDRFLAGVLLTLPLSLFGEILVRRTHHRPLGAATFASVTLVGFLLSWSLTARLRQRWSSPVHKWVDRVLWALGAVGVLVAIGRLVG